MGVWNRFVFGLLHLLLSLVGEVIFFRLGADHLTLAGGGGISGHQEFFFSINLVGRLFFPFFSHKLSITFSLRAIFFFRQALAGNFFSKSPTPPLKS